MKDLVWIIWITSSNSALVQDLVSFKEVWILDIESNLCIRYKESSNERSDEPEETTDESKNFIRCLEFNCNLIFKSIIFFKCLHKKYIFTKVNSLQNLIWDLIWIESVMTAACDCQVRVDPTVVKFNIYLPNQEWNNWSFSLF